MLTKKLFEEKAKVDNISLTPDEKLLTIAELTSLLAKKLIYTQDKNLGFDSADNQLPDLLHVPCSSSFSTSIISLSEINF